MNISSLYLSKIKQMPRPRKKRKVNNPPKMHGFKPFGMRFCETEQVIMQFEEFEVIKLVIYDNLSQDEASEKLEVSRPTLTRIYNSALKKIGVAFAEGKSILIKGGDYEFEKDWYKCNKCFKLMEGINSVNKCDECPNNDKLEQLNERI